MKKFNTLDMAGKSLKQHAYEQIMGHILAGRFGPGALLNRRGMAQEFGMSVAPVHEAMLQLESDGFLAALPRVGTRVRAACREDVIGNLVVREALECQAARMVCGKRVTDAIAQLMPLAEKVDITDASDSGRAHAEVMFHVAMVELADCPALAREYRRVMRIEHFYRINLLMSTSTGMPMKRHKDFLKALATALPAEAEQCVREHIWSGKPDALTGGRGGIRQRDRTDSLPRKV